MRLEKKQCLRNNMMLIKKSVKYKSNETHTILINGLKIFN